MQSADALWMCSMCCLLPVSLLHSVAVKRPLKKYGFSFSSFMRQIPYLRRGVLPWDRRLFPFWKNLFNFVYVFKNQSFDFLSVIDKNSVKSIRVWITQGFFYSKIIQLRQESIFDERSQIIRMVSFEDNLILMRGWVQYARWEVLLQCLILCTYLTIPT